MILFLAIPVILGLVTNDRTGDNPYPWNTAWLMDGEQGPGPI